MFCPRGASLSTPYCHNSLPGNKVQKSGRRVTPSSNGGIVPPRNTVSIRYLAGLLNSSPFRAAVKLLANKFSYTSGHIEVLAWQDPDENQRRAIEEAANDAIDAKLLIERSSET